MPRVHLHKTGQKSQPVRVEVEKADLVVHTVALIFGSKMDPHELAEMFTNELSDFRVAVHLYPSFDKEDVCENTEGIYQANVRLPSENRQCAIDEAWMLLEVHIRIKRKSAQVVLYTEDEIGATAGN